jgi:hypothetical protein
MEASGTGIDPVEVGFHSKYIVAENDLVVS